MMRRMTVNMRRHASFRGSGLLRSNKRNRLITKHSGGNVIICILHQMKVLNRKFGNSDMHSIMIDADQVFLATDWFLKLFL